MNEKPKKEYSGLTKLFIDTDKLESQYSANNGAANPVNKTVEYTSDSAKRFKKQTVLLIVVISFMYLPLLLGLIHYTVEELPAVIITLLRPIQSMSLLITAFGVFALYKQLTLIPLAHSRKGKKNFILTSILCIPVIISIVPVLVLLVVFTLISLSI